MFLPVIAAAVFMVVLTDNVVNIILPLLARTFDASIAQVGWTITGYALVLAVGVPLYGRVSDFWGVRRVFSLAFPLFAAGSLVAALAPGLGVLVLGRILQGAGAAGIPALATVAVARLLPPGRRGAAFGVIASSVGAGAAAGPVLGGVVGQVLGWRALFLALLALSLLLHVLARRVLPAENSAGRRDFDLPGGVLVGAAAGLTLFAVTSLQIHGASSVATWGSFLVAALAGAGFAWRIHAARHPFVAPTLFRNRAYVAALATAFFTMTAYLSVLVFVPLLLVLVGGLSPSAAGLVLTPGAVAMALLSPRAGRLSDSVGPRPLIVTGLALLALAALAMSFFASGGALAAAAVILAADIGIAFLNAPTTNAAAAALPAADVGAGLGIYRATFFLGAGTGPAAFGALLAARAGEHAPALNPLYHLAAPAYSDTFLAIAGVALAGLLVAFRGLPRARGERPERPEVAGDRPRSHPWPPAARALRRSAHEAPRPAGGEPRAEAGRTVRPDDAGS
jgi:MFS transporter, DHA2 family, metal-tetracycline-proton antiporter